MNENFSLDTRSLALFRVGLGSIIIYNLLELWPDIDAFFTAHGVCPLAYYYSKHQWYLNWSFHALSENHFYIAGLFILNIAFALMLITGYRTKLAAFLCWMMAVSLFHRLPALTFGGDAVLITFLMWGFFLPLGARWSIDSHLGRNTQTPLRICSIASVAYITQITLIYLVSGYSKTHPLWTHNYLALDLIFHNETFSKPWGHALTAFPGLLKMLTFLTIIIERYAVLLLFIPKWPAFFRSVCIFIFMAFHLMIFITMEIGWFQLIMMVVWLALIPTAWWQKAPQEETTRQPSQRKEWLAAGILLLIAVWQGLVISGIILHLNNKQILNKFSKLSALGIYQDWKMFSPHPPVSVETFYFVLGKEMSFQELTHQRGFENLENHRWRKFLGNCNKQSSKNFLLLESYMNWQWHRFHPDVRGTGKVIVKIRPLIPIIQSLPR